MCFIFNLLLVIIYVIRKDEKMAFKVISGLGVRAKLSDTHSKTCATTWGSKIEQFKVFLHSNFSPV